MTEPSPHRKNAKEIKNCPLCGEMTLESCGKEWHCRNSECGFNYATVPKSEREKVLDEIRDNLYCASTPHGFTIHYGKPTVNNIVLTIDFDKQEIIGTSGDKPAIAELRQQEKKE